MSARRFLLLCAWLAWLPADAHRLDEYLQATRLAIGTDRVDLEIDLTAGAAVAAKVFGWIDTNGDGKISRAEGDAYARQMLGAVALRVDGRPASIRLVESSFPDWPDMSQGVGMIRLRATAEIPAVGAGRHQVSFLNTHRPEGSVYLVNALVPENPRIRIGEQRRDYAQHGLTLDYTLAGDASPLARTLAGVVVLAIAAWLLLRLGYALAQGRWIVRRLRPGF